MNTDESFDEAIPAPPSTRRRGGHVRLARLGVLCLAASSLAALVLKVTPPA